MASRSSSSKSAKKRTRTTRRWGLFRLLWPLLALGILVVGGWCMWIDHQVRRDFEALQWALPARLYARPLELYAGAHVSLAAAHDYLQRLGYRQSSNASGTGEYAINGSNLRIRTRGFQFWDGVEAAIYADMDFDAHSIVALRGEQNAGLPLLRLEPIEIEQINPTTGEDRLPITLAEVPPALVKAVVSVEDQRFYTHHGIDPLSILRALWADIRAGAVVQGGSTLTQQLIKNLYLGKQQTLRRKAEEAVMAVALELHFSKEQILTAYMNEIFLGQDGNRAIHGFALAAEYYFGRPLKELQLAELATLAGIGRGATYYNPLRYPQRALERRNVVLERMYDNGEITEQELAKAKKAELKVREKSLSNRGYPAFMELVYDNLSRDYDQKALHNEGLKIFTTLDVTMQSVVEAKLNNAVKAVERAKNSKNPLEAAVVIADANTGEVRALAGGRQSGYQGFNRALHAQRPIGSLVKPGVYLTALESSKFNLATVLQDQAISLKQPNGDVWEPHNYEEETSGPVYLFDALQRSLNLATIDLGLQLGVDKVADTLQRLGFAGTIPRYPSLFLGAVDMTPFDVAQMYQTLASGGFRSPLRAVEAVTTATGEPLAYYGIQTQQVVDPTAVFLLEDAMHGVFVNGTARSVANRLVTNLPLAGKTGTTNDLRDSWFAGYGSDLVGVVWLGHDNNAETGLTGATGALRVWTDLMLTLDIQPRQPPVPAEVQWEKVAGRPVSNAEDRDCSTTISLPFHLQRMPEVAYSCEVTDSFFDRVIDRFRSLGQ